MLRSGGSRSTPNLIPLAVLALWVVAAAPPDAEARRTRRRGWVWNKACDERPPDGADGEVPEWPVPIHKPGLKLDPVDTPIYLEAMDEPEPIVMKITAFNDSLVPQSATVEVEICHFRETCVSGYGDYGEWGDQWLLGPMERRSLLLWVDDELLLGRHGVNVVLLDGDGRTADRWTGPSIVVGQAELEVEEVAIFDHPVPEPDRRGRLKPVKLGVVDATLGMPLSASILNSGTAPDKISVGFIIDGGDGWSCGRELYSQAIAVPPGDDSESVSVAWTETPETTPIKSGHHSLTVLVFDGEGDVASATRGIPFEIKKVIRSEPPEEALEAATPSGDDTGDSKGLVSAPANAPKE